MPSFLVTTLPVFTKIMNVAKANTRKKELIKKVEKCACTGDNKATIPRINVELNAKLPRRSPTAMLL